MLELHSTYIKLLSIDVEFILGLKVKGLRIDMNNDNVIKKDLCNKYCDKKGQL